MPSVRELAYLGDAVFELHVRSRLLAGGIVVQADADGGSQVLTTLHRQTVSRVRASAQARLVHALTPELTAEELDVVRRGRNVKGAVPRSAKVGEYRLATGFEALLGHLHHTGQQGRLAAILARVDGLWNEVLKEAQA